MPLRAIAKFSNGWVTRKMVDDLVFACNGHFFRGMGKCIADFFRGQTAGKRFRKQLQAREKA
jgi:beta-glucosidase